MSDPTEAIRREMVAEINAQPGSREALEAEHGQVWDTSQLTEDYDVLGFAAPLVVVHRKSDGKRGSLCSNIDLATISVFPPSEDRVTGAFCGISTGGPIS